MFLYYICVVLCKNKSAGFSFHPVTGTHANARDARPDARPDGRRCAHTRERAVVKVNRNGRATSERRQWGRSRCPCTWSWSGGPQWSQCPAELGSSCPALACSMIDHHKREFVVSNRCFCGRSTQRAGSKCQNCFDWRSHKGRSWAWHTAYHENHVHQTSGKRQEKSYSAEI